MNDDISDNWIKYRIDNQINKSNIVGQHIQYKKIFSKITLIHYAFQVGFGFCIIYAALLTKTNRISRIFHSALKSARRPSFISPKSQVIITMFLVSIQVCIHFPDLSIFSMFLVCIQVRIYIYILKFADFSMFVSI